MGKLLTAFKLLRKPHKFLHVLIIRLSWCRPLMALIFAIIDSCDAHALRRRKRQGAPPLPPVPNASLRFRVSNTVRLDEFLATAGKSNADLKAALAKVDKTLPDFQRILDFGCGCGRMTGTLIFENPGSTFWATDIDAEAVAWCAAHFPTAHFAANPLMPPSRYESDFFDLAYSHSVFTHLPEDAGKAWLSELHRVLKPGAYLVFTVCGRHIWEPLPEKHKAIIQKKGFLFLEPKMALTDGAFHTPEYIERQVEGRFDLLQYIPRGMQEYQDMVVLRKK